MSELEWSQVAGAWMARGLSFLYDIQATDADVRLTRWSWRESDIATMARQAARDVIVFPLSRGPGRPPARPETDRAVKDAKSLADLYEAGGIEWRGPETVPALPPRRESAVLLRMELSGHPDPEDVRHLTETVMTAFTGAPGNDWSVVGVTDPEHRDDRDYVDWVAAMLRAENLSEADRLAVVGRLVGILQRLLGRE
jgi:hypothetical protein